MICLGHERTPPIPWLAPRWLVRSRSSSSWGRPIRAVAATSSRGRDKQLVLTRAGRGNTHAAERQDRLTGTQKVVSSNRSRSRIKTGVFGKPRKFPGGGE